MNQLTIGRRIYQVPATFHELSGRQLVAIVGLLHAGLPVPELRLRLLLALLEVRRHPRLAVNLWFRLSAEQRHELLPLTDFLLKEPHLVEQRLPTLRQPRTLRWLYGPAGSFADLTFGEWMDGEAAFFRYERSPSEDALDVLVAVLYRPRRRGQRQAFDPAACQRRIPQVSRLPLAAKLAVRMWYAGCRTAWIKKYDGTVFNTSAGNGAAQSPRQVWSEILAERAGSPVHYEEYSRQLLPNVLFDLDLRIRRRREEQEALKK